jgi:amidase
LAGVDSKDKSTFSKQKKESDYLKFFRHKLFVGKRIGVEKKQQGSNQYMHSLQKKSIDLIISLGTVVEIDYLDAIKNNSIRIEVMQYEFKEGVNSYLKQAGHKIKSLKDVY